MKQRALSRSLLAHFGDSRAAWGLRSCVDNAVEVQMSREPRPQRAASTAHSAWGKRDIVLLTALTLLSLFLRITWAVTRNVVIENEGAEYTRLA